jgi:putative SbcD/Mre11-related phosphoesterase
MTKFLPFYPLPILIIERSNSEKYIVIADIHIGFEEELNIKGIFIESKKIVDELLNLLSSVIIKTEINNLIILGDLKSSIKIITRSEWNNVPYFLNSLSRLCNVYLVPGNHDSYINHLVPNSINLMSIKGIELDNVLLTHGHTTPIIGRKIDKIIIGHLHPILIKEGNILNGQRVWIRIILRKIQTNKEKNGTENSQWFRKRERKMELIIIPNFNNYLNHYSNYNYEKITRKGKTKVPLLTNLITKRGWEMDQVFIISLDGDIIGSENELKKIL